MRITQTWITTSVKKQVWKKRYTTLQAPRPNELLQQLAWKRVVCPLSLHAISSQTNITLPKYVYRKLHSITFRQFGVWTTFFFSLWFICCYHAACEYFLCHQVLCLLQLKARHVLGLTCASINLKPLVDWKLNPHQLPLITACDHRRSDLSYCNELEEIVGC